EGEQQHNASEGPHFQAGVTTGWPDGAVTGASLGSRTRQTRIAARNRNTPPATTADNRLLSSTCDITQPKPNDATISGITMKKLKIPMYTPVLSFGNEPARIAYGIERMLAQASPTPTIESNSSVRSEITVTENKQAPEARPTPTIESNSSFGSWIAVTETRPAPPASRQNACARVRPRARASDGRKN